ncbi:hypothetical protein CFC21_068540 [Triticum aestivum]|uniref:F-box domain-containing protein n=2 Tax=Triticum aestivum TaxID=4565 RepID=A0A9R1KPU7_WHEAT|nr:uncharacterized protein LOC123108195 [Triticum aestivum]KAF7061885.1 hypothetical protein CFC21_068540 [Triticum aestivum]
MEDDDAAPHLPMDILYKIPTHISDPASLARLASSCKFWRNLIKDPAFLERLRRRHRDHGFTPSLLLGFFYQDKKRSSSDLWKYYIDKTRCLAPSFMRMSELSHFVGNKSARNAIKPLSLETFIPGLGASLNFYKPIASQDNFLVLRRQSEVATPNGQALNDLLCVCNPLTGETFEIPSHRYVPPDHYALFVTNDVNIYGCMSQSFQLTGIWIKKGDRFICECYSSKTGTWTRSQGVPHLMHGLYLVSSSATASGGVIHWLCGSWKQMSLTHIATLHIGNMELSYLELPPEAKRNKAPVLGSSADGGILLLIVQGLQMLLWKHSNALGTDSSSWVLSERIDMRSSLPQRVATLGIRAKVRLEMFRGKSGTVVLWIDEEGLFVFSLSDRSMRRIDSAHVTKKYFLCPYEIDWLSCLAITNLVVDGSLSLDAERQKTQGRWRTLMGRNLATNGAS